jgi:hypothetical protein
MNTLTAPLTLFPVAAGMIASVSSYAVAFTVAAAASLAALVTAFRLRTQQG